MRHQCGNCNRILGDSEIGECPECGFLCHPHIEIADGMDHRALHPSSEEACQAIDAEFFTGDAINGGDLSNPRFGRLHYFVTRWYNAIQKAIRQAREQEAEEKAS